MLWERVVSEPNLSEVDETEPALSWLTLEFETRRSTRIGVNVEGPCNETQEFISRFVREEYGAQVLTWSTDRLDSTADLEITSIDECEPLGPNSDRVQVSITVQTVGRPAFESLVETSRRLPDFRFELSIDHSMCEGSLTLQAGKVVSESLIDWTERDEELWWIPGPGEPWKPREPG